jgi:hypothetical protein
MKARVLVGHLLNRLPEIADESVHMVVTSPPYWNLRDYGTAEWLGRPPADTTACDGERCTVELPREKQPGSLKIECRDCPAWALVEIDGRESDPKTFAMPCGRVRGWWE